MERHTKPRVVLEGVVQLNAKRMVQAGADVLLSHNLFRLPFTLDERFVARLYYSRKHIAPVNTHTLRTDVQKR